MSTLLPSQRSHRTLQWSLLCIAIATVTAAVSAQEVYLTGDIGWESSSNIMPSEVQSMAAFGGGLLFAAHDETYTPDSDHTALWRSEGTPATTELVVDLYTLKDLQGMIRSGPGSLLEWNGYAYFAGADDTHGMELWRTDGTMAGTSMVKDINPGSGSSGPSYLTIMGGRIYFSAGDGTDGTELWCTDGTEAGTQQVRDIRPGSASSYPASLIAVGGTLFFEASDSAGDELWKSDGTYSGTVMVKDIRAGSLGSDPRYLVNVNGVIYFNAYTSNGYELWKSDGTSAGTVEVADIEPGSTSSNPYNLTALGSLVVFRAQTSAVGNELWISDGTAIGTQPVDINPGSSGSYPSNLKEFNGAVYFSANDGVNGSELWSTDGTVAGTALVKDLRASGQSSPYAFAEYGGLLYFAASDSSTNRDNLWRTDGSEAGTERVALTSCYRGFSGYPTYLVAAGSDLYFRCGQSLYISDGTEAGTSSLRTLIATTIDAQTTETAALGHSVFFDAEESSFSEPYAYRSDGTENGVQIIANTSQAFASSSTGVYLASYEPSMDYEPWVSAELGWATLLKDINPSGSSSPEGFTEIGGLVYFSADDGVYGYEPWVTDGTEGGTRLLADCMPGTWGIGPREFTDVGGIAMFIGYGTNDDAIWRSDGTEAGTVMVREINNPEHNGICSLAAAGGTLFFTADDGSTGRELWVSDGTGAGTVLLSDINSGSADSMVCWSGNGGVGFTALGGIAYFAADDGVNGVELWRSDGTGAGTYMVVDLHPTGSSNPSWIVEWNGALYFSADDGTTGNELWRSDGTGAGTTLVADIWPGGISSSPREITVARGRLNFTASNGSNGLELWKSDGTAPGTVLVEDLYPGIHSSLPTLLTASDGPLYFVADDGTVGKELWAACEPRPNPVITAPPSVCQYSVGNIASVTDTGPGSQFVWEINGGSVIDGQGTPTIEFEAGDWPDVFITARVFNSSGCGGKVQTSVPTSAASPAPVISGPSQVCPKESAVLDAGPGYTSYSWSPGGETAQSINTSPSQTTMYTVRVTDAVSCEYQDQHQLTVDDPAPTFGGLSSATELAEGCGVHLEWSAAAPSCASTPPLVYNVYRDEGATVTPGPATLLAPCVTLTSYDDLDVLPSTSYAYVVRAENAAVGGGGLCHNGAEEANTTQRTLTLTAGCAGLPGRVASLTARASDGSVLLEWVNPGASYGLTRLVSNDVNPPVDPADGITYDDIGSPSAKGSYLWTPLPNGTTQNLAAFINSSPTASGLWSPAFHVSSRPFNAPSNVPWVFSTGASALAPPGIRPGSSIFTVSNDRRLHCMTTGSGGGMWPPAWQPAVMNGPADARPATVPFPTTTIGGASVVTFLSSLDGHVYAIDSLTGAELWRSDALGDAVTAAPSGLLTDFGNSVDQILVGSRTASGDSAFYGLDLISGATVWSFDNGGGPDGIGIISGQASVDPVTERVYFASRRKPGGSSSTVWCLQVMAPPTYVQLVWARDLGGIDSSPILRGGILYVGNNEGEVYALDPDTGNDLWAAPHATHDGPVKGFVWVDTTQTPTRLFFSTTNQVHGVADLGATPSPLFSPVAVARPSPVILYNGSLWLGSGNSNGSVLRLDPATGGELDIVTLGNPLQPKLVGSPTFDSTSLLLVGTDEGRVYAVEVQ